MAPAQPSSRGVKVLSRNPLDYLPATPTTPAPVPRSATAAQPFRSQREYTRALNATKLERAFAKPFIRAFQGHIDGVYTLCKWNHRLDLIASGGADGHVRLWDTSAGRCIWANPNAHSGFINGLAAIRTDDHDDIRFLTAGFDKTIKLWDLSNLEETEPKRIFTHHSRLNSADHHWTDPMFCTASESIDIWHESRTRPQSSYNWGDTSIRSVRYNPAQPNLLGATCNDCTIALVDTRADTPIRKLRLLNRSNAVAWNPMEPINFVTPNEDGKIYSFDMRKLDHPAIVFRDFLNAVTDVDFSPTGNTFVAGSYDNTLRLYNTTNPHSIDVYFLRRMTKVFSVRFSPDARFIFSASDDGNVRKWKACAWSKPASNAREQRAMDERERLKRTYAAVPEVRRISKHRHLPKAMLSERKKQDVWEEAQIRKEKRRVRWERKTEAQQAEFKRKKRTRFIVEEME